MPDGGEEASGSAGAGGAAVPGTVGTAALGVLPAVQVLPREADALDGVAAASSGTCRSPYVANRILRGHTAKTTDPSASTTRRGKGSAPLPAK